MLTHEKRQNPGFLAEKPENCVFANRLASTTLLVGAWVHLWGLDDLCLLGVVIPLFVARRLCLNLTPFLDRNPL